MGFWGLEVKPGKPQSYHPKNETGKLHVTQATLGASSGKGKSVIQCSIGDKAPINLCSLLPDKTESCPLNLEFDDNDETVVFSVIGGRSVHLSGYLEEYDQDEDDDDNDSDGIGMGESESDDLSDDSDYDSEDDDDSLSGFENFLDNSLEMYRNSSVPNRGVVIEEIEDEEKPAEDNKTKRPKKKSQASKESAHVPELVSEDEDGLPIRNEKDSEPESKASGEMDIEQGSNKKRKAKASEEAGVQESKKKKNQNEKKKGETASNGKVNDTVQTANVLTKPEATQNSLNAKDQKGNVNSAITEDSKTPDKSAEKKNKKKKKKSSEEAKVEGSAEKPKSDLTPEGDQGNSKASSQERTFPNGFVVEELQMGKPNAKRASPGNTVSIRYIGKLQKNGKIFDSNIGKAPFKFRLGVGQVIKGWDVGVRGMRVGDKRRLTIPPSMGYGQSGAGSQIPPNAWLVFDVELINVK